MQLDTEFLRQHYASLSDDALLAIDRTELVEAARNILDLEVNRRNLALPEDVDDVQADRLDGEADGDESPGDREMYTAGDEPEWLEDAAEVYAHAVHSETALAPDAVKARDALAAAGIPCFLELCEIPPEKSLQPYGTHRWRLMVPGDLNMHAASVLDREIFNPDFETEWKAHLENLSDEDLRAMEPKVVFCGLFDRIARVNRVYASEMARRGIR